MKTIWKWLIQKGYAEKIQVSGGFVYNIIESEYTMMLPIYLSLYLNIIRYIKSERPDLISQIKQFTKKKGGFSLMSNFLDKELDGGK
jgi:hypothetical protein